MAWRGRGGSVAETLEHAQQKIVDGTVALDARSGSAAMGAACETPGAGGLAQSSILLVNTHSPWIADWMPAPEDRRHAERWK